MRDRRSFLLTGASAAAMVSGDVLRAATAAEAEGTGKKRSPFFQFTILRLQYGAQIKRMTEWFGKRALPLMLKSGFGPTGFFNVEVGPHIPAVYVLVSYPSLAKMEATWTRYNALPGWPEMMGDLYTDEPAFYREDNVLLQATDFSPRLKVTAAGDPAHKIFELRIYEAPTHKAIRLLHERFTGGEITIFHKCGIKPIFYANTVFGLNQPNLVYMIPFDDLAQREKAWTAFRASPDWHKLRYDSIRQGGEIVRNISSILMSPNEHSQIR